MPNWCENDLRVDGPKTDVERFLQTVRTSDEELFDFASIIPYPEIFRLQDEIAWDWAKANKGKEGVDWNDAPRDGFNSGGYEWCIANWGTKWGAYRAEIDEPEIYEDQMEVMIHFNTAWSPPLPVINEASRKFPTLGFDLRYFESGMAFNGVLQCRAGDELTNECGAYYGSRGG